MSGAQLGSLRAKGRAPMPPPRRRRRSAHCAARATRRCRRCRRSAWRCRPAARTMPLSFDINSVRDGVPDRHPHDPFAGMRKAIGGGAAPFVVNADDGGPVIRNTGDQPFLHRTVMLHRAVAIEMILAEIDEDPDRGIERRREIDLIRRAFDDVDAYGLDVAGAAAAPATGSRCRYCRRVARPCPRPPQDARSTPWWWICRWCR